MLPWKRDKRKSGKRGRPQAMRKQPAAPLFEWRPPAWLSASLGMMLLLGAIVWYLPKEQWLPIDSIRLVGRFEHVDQEKLQRLLEPYLGQGFFTVDIKGLRQKTESMPWVRESRVRRIWPNRLQLQVVERVAVARFDDRRLIDRNGELFSADAREFGDLPLIRGYAKQTRQLLEKYADLKPRFERAGLNIAEWLEDDKGSLRLRFDNGMELRIGSRGREQKIDQFLAVYPQYIAPQQDRIAIIDFRYSNGFAVAWKEPRNRDSKEPNARNNRRDNRNV